MQIRVKHFCQEFARNDVQKAEDENYELLLRQYHISSIKEEKLGLHATVADKFLEVYLVAIKSKTLSIGTNGYTVLVARTKLFVTKN